MASKNLGAVIQRAISDGAFRRQLQSDPATALRGFNLTPDEVAAIRSGDSGKLISLGVDQRMSKVFTLGDTGMAGGAARQSVSDLAVGSTSSTVASDMSPSAREGIVGDPASIRDAHTTGNLSGVRAIQNSEPVDTRGASTDATLGGTRAIHNTEPVDTRGAVDAGNPGGTRAIFNTEPVDTRGAVDAGNPGGTRAIFNTEPVDTRGATSIGDLSGARAVNDVAPFGTPGTSAVEDPNSPEFAAAQNAGSGAAGSAALNDPYSGQYQGVSPDFQARLGQAGASDGAAGGSGTSQIAADDNYAVSSHMADSGDATSIRPIHDDAPFEGNANAAAPSGEFLGGDARLDPGTDSAHGFIPSDSADVQREMLEGGDHGNALGNTGGGHPS